MQQVLYDGNTKKNLEIELLKMTVILIRFSVKEILL